MRQFTNLEKDIIKKILEIDHSSEINSLQVILNSIDFFKYENITFYIKVNGQFVFDINSYENIDSLHVDKDKIKKHIFKNILIINSLMNYLCDNNYLVSKQYKEIVFPIFIGNKPLNEDFNLLFQFEKDGKNAEKFYNLSLEEFYPTQKLQEFVNNDFIDEIEIRHREELNYTRKGLYVAVISSVIATIGLIATSYFSYLNHTKKDFDKNNIQKMLITNHNLKIKLDEKIENSLLKISQSEEKKINVIVDCLCENDNLK